MSQSEQKPEHSLKMPPMLYGTAWKKERTAELVKKAIRYGFKGIDTACQPKHYNEAGVGEALRQLAEEGYPRTSLFVQTKFTPLSGQDADTVPYDPDADLATQVAQSFQMSQKNLHTSYVDSLVLHSPLTPFSRLLSVWQAMEKIYDEGGARQLGISNCYDLPLLKRLHAASRIPPSVVQNRFYADTGYDTELRLWCRAQGVAYQSFWSLTANPHALSSKVVAALAASHGKTPAQIFFRFLIQSGITPLTGTTSDRHMQEDLQIIDLTLTDDDFANIGRSLQSP